jgi:BolA family transcriptional regulator, general stress-responsive regulator
MTTFLDSIKTKINNELKPEYLSLIDNSAFHTKHKSFDPKKFHIKLIIKSSKLKEMSKIDAHRLVFSILGEEMKQTIHALEIEIQ